MGIVTVDFETYYDTEYSLRKMTTVEYVLDPRFQTIMCHVKRDDGPTRAFIGHEAVAAEFATIDWSRNALLAHHTKFDGAIAAWHYGVRPAMFLCSLSMGRAMLNAITGSVSLEALSRYLNLPPKGTEVHHMIGKRLEHFTPDEMARYAAYCARDNDNCKSIFDIIRPSFPTGELDVIDMVLRMFIEPQAIFDPTRLASHLEQTRIEVAGIMARVSHFGKKQFTSNPQFAQLLEQHGVSVPMKISKTTGEWTWALAKGDRAFKELCADENMPLAVQALLAARTAAKSTIEETRTQRLLTQSGLRWPRSNLRCIAVVPLKYSGAHTHRFSGDDKTNWQNFKRGSALRESVLAPPGMRIVHRDASQIEARITAWLARCVVMLEAFAQGRDVYSEFATIFYERLITKDMKPERFVGKTSILGLGFGMGWERFKHTLFIGQGKMSVDLHPLEARRLVNLYRETFMEIPTLWKRAVAMLYQILELSGRVPFRPMFHGSRVDPIDVVTPGLDSIWLPSGLAITYRDLRQERHTNPDGRVDVRWVYTGAYGEPVFLHGGKVTENIVQALARIVITEIMRRVRSNTGFRPLLSTHDSLDYCVPEREAEPFDSYLTQEFTYRLPWCRDLPLASEGGWGVTMAAAEDEDHPGHNQ